MQLFEHTEWKTLQHWFLTVLKVLVLQNSSNDNLAPLGPAQTPHNKPNACIENIPFKYIEHLQNFRL